VRVLLDTQALFWWFDDFPAVSPKARRTIASSENEVIVSAASAWELAIKTKIGKLNAQPLLDRLDAAVACTRPVVDRGWLPAGRQVGLTGRALTPRLYVTVGIRGAFEHLIGVAGAGTILAVHPARDASVFDAADVGIVAPWRDVVDPLVATLGPRSAGVA